MSRFLAVLVEHGYSTSQYERDVITAAGGEFIDAQDRPLAAALELCRQADGILLRRIQVTAEMMAQWPRCRIIVRYGVGTDNVDIDAATAAGIIVGNVPDYCIDEVSTHAVALLLACVRDVTGTHQRMAGGDWDVRRPVPVYRLAGKTVGLIGLGQIGSAVAAKLAGWGLRLVACDPFAPADRARGLGVELTDLETLCRQADCISLHVPLLPETRHLIGLRALGWVKPGCILVNTARGPIVDTAALLAALDAGRLARAALDVFEEEPLPAGSPLRCHPRVTLTDHMAWYSEESQVQLQTSAARSVATACTGGVPASLSNPQVVPKLGKLDQWRPAPCMQWQLERMRRAGKMP